MSSLSNSILLPISLGLNYQHHHENDIYGILEIQPIEKRKDDDEKIDEWTSHEDSNSMNDHFSPATAVPTIYHLENAVCLLNIPDLFLPKDILSYFQSFSSLLLMFRIYRHYLNANQYVLLLFFPSKRESERFIDYYQDKMISSLYDVYCKFHSIVSWSLTSYYEQYIPLLYPQQLYMLLHCQYDSNDLLSLISSFSASSSSSSSVGLVSNPSPKSFSLRSNGSAGEDRSTVPSTGVDYMFPIIENDENGHFSHVEAPSSSGSSHSKNGKSPYSFVSSSPNHQLHHRPLSPQQMQRKKSFDHYHSHRAPFLHVRFFVFVLSSFTVVPLLSPCIGSSLPFMSGSNIT
jgi:hypothetical protein